VPGDVLQSVREDVRDIGAENTARIITEFLGDLPGALDGILTADRAVDQRKAAHKLKGAAANFRLDALCQTLASIEKVAPDIDEALAAEAKAKMAEAKVLLMEAADEEALQVCAGSTNR
jgi:two-component system sensor histidine kinase TorS